MSIADQFWQYANEAMLSADNAETDEEKQTPFGLARTWTQAALLERHAQLDTRNTAVAAVGPAQWAASVVLVWARRWPRRAEKSSGRQISGCEKACLAQ